MDWKQDAQLKMYEALARDFDERFSRENANHLYKLAEIGRAIFTHLPVRDGGYDILEIGGGTGIHALHFMHAYGARVRRFVLSDLSPAMLDQARGRLQQFPQVEYLVSTGEAIATASRFDAIYVSGAMHHFSDPATSVVEMHRHLVPQGMLVVCEPNVWNPANFVLAAARREEWGQFKVTRPNIRALLERSGFDVRVDRVLHWKGGNDLARSLWPYERLERQPLFDRLAVMFLLGAQRPAEPTA